MIVFWLFAAGLLALALALLLPGLVRQHGTPSRSTAPSASRANLALLRDQLAQIDADLAGGALTAEQHRLSRSEIEQRVLDEEAVSEGPRRAGSARRTAWLVGSLVPLFALGVYGLKGNLGALDPQASRAQAEPGGDVSLPQMEELVDKLAKRLEGQTTPQADDAQGWAMLARSYAFMQRFPEASRAYGRALALDPKNAQLLADHADVLAALRGQQINGEPLRLVEQALQIDPNHPKALALAGSAAFERRDFAAAVGFWTRARQFVPADSDFAKALDGSLAEAKQAAGGPGAVSTSVATMAAASAPTAPGATVAAGASPAAPTGAQVTGRVSLAPALTARAAPTDTVFIFARAAEGPRMPLAILRRTVADLPIAFTLDDSMAMSAQMKLSNFPLVVVGARISRSGNATPQAGDLQGQAAPTKIGGGAVDLVIDSVLP